MKKYSLDEWAFALEYNRNFDEWSDSRIEHTQWQDNSAGFNDTVPFDELVLYVTIKHLYNESKVTKIEPPSPISDEFESMLQKRVAELIAGAGYYPDIEKPDSERVKGFKTKYKDALLVEPDYHKDLSSENKEYVARGIRHHLREYADSFPFDTPYEIKTYKDAKYINTSIVKWKKYLLHHNITRENLIKKSTNNTRGYSSLTVTKLKEIIRNEISLNLVYNVNTDKKRRISSRAIELILR